MKLLYEYLSKIKENPFADDIQASLEDLDQRVMLVHETYGSRPEEDKLHLAIREAQWKPLDPNSITTLALATSFLVSNFHQRVDDELCAHSYSDEKYGSFNGNVFLFKVSFLSFGESFSSIKPNEEAEKCARTLERMRGLGYIIDEAERHNRKHYTLRNCSENIRLLKSYFSKIGLTGHLYCESFDDAIRDVSGSIDFTSYVPYTAEEVNEGWDELTRPIGKNPTEDQMFRLQSNLKEFSETICSFFSLGEDQFPMMADLLVSYTYELESMLNYHGSVWEMEEEKHAPIRAKNRANLDRLEVEKAEAFRLVNNPLPIFNSYFQPLYQHVEEIGLQVDETRIFDYGLVRMKLRLPIFENMESPLYDGFDDDRSQPIIYVTNEKLDEIEKRIQEKCPKFKLTQNMEARFDKGQVVLQGIYGELYLY